MQIIPITCPKCGGKFRIKAENPAALGDKNFICPKCKMATPFGLILKIGNPMMHTRIGGADPLHTKIGGVGGGNQPAGPLKTTVFGSTGMSVVELVIAKSGKSFLLNVGTYILGRDSIDSRATLKIAPDVYMSRQHAKLVITIENGKVVCLLSPMASTNAIYVNGGSIPVGVPATLKNGDEILLGMTTLKVIIK